MRKSTLAETGCAFLLVLSSAVVPAQEDRGYPDSSSTEAGTGAFTSDAADYEAAERGRASATSAPVGGESSADTRPPESFKSPDAAVKTLIGALRGQDDTRLDAIFGPQGRSLISSGDAVADRRERQSFLRHYDRKHSLQEQDSGVVKLIVGESAWPFAVPIVKGPDGYHFDSTAGSKEVLFRRIGRNERNAVAVCGSFVAAQKDYAAAGRDGHPAGRYAQKFRSDEGKQNGLYWPVESGGQRSPAGPLLASAADQGYAAGAGRQTPYHGYLFRVLTSQGRSAQNGAKDYIDSDGAQTGGFALIAYPAEYGRSGVKSFIVNQDAIVYEKDLGAKTIEIARGMSKFEPEGWRVAL